MSLMRVMTEVTGGPGRGILRVRKFTPRAPHPRGASAVPQSSARTSGTRRGKGLTRMNGSTTVSAEHSLWLVPPEDTARPPRRRLSCHSGGPYDGRTDIHVRPD